MEVCVFYLVFKAKVCLLTCRVAVFRMFAKVLNHSYTVHYRFNKNS